MELSFTPEEIAFRDEVRAFLRDDLPEDIKQKAACNAVYDKSDYERWHAVLNARGWLAPGWPREYGGAEWTPAQRHIFEQEACLAGAPRIMPFGLLMLGPVLLKFGSEEQKAEYLPRILDGRDWWCQGYSEPGAGSDLASLKTRAVRDGDDYVINGQKTWTTLGQHANRIFCLVRTATEGKPQEGISFVLVDLDTPGVEMRPIRLIEGGHEVNEVFFTDVRAPVKNRVGEENQGWTIAKYLLTHERTNIAGVGFSSMALERLKTLARQVRRGGRPLIEHPLFAARLARAEIELEALRITNLRIIDDAAKKGAPGPESSILKIKGSLVRQGLNDLTRRALGAAAAPFPSEDVEGNLDPLPSEYANETAEYFNNRKISIFGGSNEIQKNILTKTMLGL